MLNGANGKCRYNEWLTKTIRVDDAKIECGMCATILDWFGCKHSNTTVQTQTKDGPSPPARAPSPYSCTIRYSTAYAPIRFDYAMPMTRRPNTTEATGNCRGRVVVHSCGTFVGAASLQLHDLRPL